MEREKGIMKRIFMPKRPGFMSAKEIVKVLHAIPNSDHRKKENRVTVSITEVVSNIDDIPNKIGLKLSWPYKDTVLLVRENVKSLVEDFGSSESDDWIGEKVDVGITHRELEGKEVWGILVRGSK